MTPPLFRTSHGGVVGQRLTLDGAEGRHAADVRRLLPGEPITLTDGVGALLTGTVVEVRRGELDIEIDEVAEISAPGLRIVVVQALAKGGRDEDAVESMTEVGVDEFIGWQASRSIAKWTDRTESKWLSITEAAAKQSRRRWWPTVSGPASTGDVVRRAASADLVLVLSETASAPLASIPIPSHGEVVIIVGPEGGISPAEETAFTDVGGVIARLGDTVLRSSTAGVVAAALVSARSRWA